MTKQQALTRRADILLSWIEKGNFTYIDANSIDTLYKFIDSIIDIMQAALGTNRHRKFTNRLKDVHVALTGAEEQDLVLLYETSLQQIKSILQDYKTQLSSLDFS